MGILGSLFGNELKEMKKAGLPYVKIPKRTQDVIEVQACSEDGIFQFQRHKYSKCYRFQDINYTAATNEEQKGMIDLYCRILNSIDVEFKIIMNNRYKDMDEFRDKILISMKHDKNDRARISYNDVIEEKLKEGTQGIEKERYLVLMVTRNNLEEAKTQFTTLEANLTKAFALIGCEIFPMNGHERLKVLYDFYHLGSMDGFSMDPDAIRFNGRDLRNDICNTKLRFFEDYYEDEHKFHQALFFKAYPKSLDDRFFKEITSLPFPYISTIDVIPIPKDLTIKILNKKYMGIENDIRRQQQTRNRNNDFSSDISYLKKIQKKDCEEIMEAVRENDESLFYVGVTMIITADSKEELKARKETIQNIGKGQSVVIDVLNLQQREAVNTALPIGCRQMDTMRSMLTVSLAALNPFDVQELSNEGGNFYGINQISKNLNIGNRKRLINGNGFIFGIPGSGKSFFCKLEMGFVFLSTDDDIIIIDPMSEYFDIAQTFGGAIINMSSHTENHVNPLAVDVWNDLDLMDSKGVMREKCEFMLGLCGQIMGNLIGPRHRSIIDRCVTEMYMNVVKSRKKAIPVMSDFYEILMRQPEDEAKEIALCLELFVSGSLNIFNHQTNVDVDNRLTVYGIRDMGTDLSPIAMLVMLESIQARVIENSKKGKATWIYIDEFHCMLGSEFTAKYLNAMWKKVRKQGGLCTGITQNVGDILASETAASILANSEFVALLKQGGKDDTEIAEAVGISDAQLRFVTNSPKGTGLLKFGNVVVPFDATVPKESTLYDLYNTNIHEKIEQKQKKG